jgi:uncharacterized repeat protein (TIGR01451 family)
MFREKTDGKSFLARAALSLIGMAGLWLLGIWLTSTPTTRASDAIAQLTFQSPIPPVGNPQLSLVKTVDNDTPQAGDEIVYTLTYSTTNSGSQAFNVRLYDFLPAGVQFVSANPSASLQDGALLFTAPSIGATDAIATVRVRVREGYDQLVNHALVAADFVPPAHAALVTGVDQPPTWLRLTKTGYEAVLINGEMVYTLHCENIGDETAYDVTVVDVLPTGVPLVEASPPPDVVNLPLLSWSLGDLEPGQSRTVALTVTAPATAGVITNTALADARQWVVTPTVFATQVISDGAILRVTKQGSAPAVDVDDELVYTLRYENAGSQLADEVTLVDTLPADVAVKDVSPAPAFQTAQHITWTLALAPGTSGEMIITTTVEGSAGRTLHNVADITGPDSMPGHAELDTPVRPRQLYLPIAMKSF